MEKINILAQTALGNSQQRTTTASCEAIAEPEGKRTYNLFEQGWKLFEEKAPQVIQGFELDDDNFHVCQSLVAYFGRYEDKCKQLGIDLNKSILLKGGIGCGKTSLMNFFAKNFFAPYTVLYSRDLAMEVLRGNHNDIIQKYGEHSFASKHGLYGKIYDHSKPFHICLDDIGAEGTFRVFGNEINIVEAIITFRYRYILTGMRTHLTSNLPSKSDLKPSIMGIYGDRMASRLREMVNEIEFPIIAKDRRK